MNITEVDTWVFKTLLCDKTGIKELSLIQKGQMGEETKYNNDNQDYEDEFINVNTFLNLKTNYVGIKILTSNLYNDTCI